MTNFTDDPEKIGRNSNRKKGRNMADAGNEDPQCRQPEEHQEDKTGDEDTAAPQKCTYLIWTTHHSAKH